MISGSGIARVGISEPDSGIASGVGAVAGIATVVGIGAALAQAVGAASGIATATSVGASTFSGIGSIAASASVSGISASLAAATGSVAGIATVVGVGAARASATGMVNCAATVSGIGAAILNRSALAWRRYVVSSFRQELSPPILATEQAMVEFDFAPELTAGEAVLLPPTLTCSATWGTDDAPSSRIIGDATVNPSPSTAAADGAVAQLVGGMRGAVRYKFSCTVATTRGQTLSRSAYLNCNS